mgnify:CR=1 FL=1
MEKYGFDNSLSEAWAADNILNYNNYTTNVLKASHTKFMAASGVKLFFTNTGSNTYEDLTPRADLLKGDK